jgi:hypothetical protein
MKNLVLSAMVAAMASQAAACIIVDDDDEPSGNRIAVTWNYKVNGATQGGCPAGAVGVDLLIQPTGASVPTVYEYNCSDKTMIEYVGDGQYQIWVELVTSSGATYAQSLSVIDNVVATDKDITVDIHEDRGFFFTAWALEGRTSRAPLTCSQVPTLQSISLLATPVGSGGMIDTFLECSLGAGASKALAVGEYSVKVDAVNSANASLGGLPVLLRQPIGDRNQVTNLGSMVIPIDGQ